MRAYVGVTDRGWSDFLAARPGLAEVNFWRPGGARQFRVLKVGEPFFFKSHAPDNQIGGGFFSGFAALRVSEAWDFFGEGNGAATLAEMRAQIGRYRREPIAADDDPSIGCVFLRNVTFFPPDDLIGPPPDFAGSIVQGKSYDLADPAILDYFVALLARLGVGPVPPEVLAAPWHRDGPVYGDPRLVPQRLGQQAFQAVVLDTYARHCAITGARIRPVLQAAHILPLPAGGEHRVDNGLLLRSDVHTLFDRGYLGVDPGFRLLVSPRLRAEFGNGEEFYTRAGSVINLPGRRQDRPRREFLEWHLDTIFQSR